jgi:hypothetical protein
MDAYDEAVDYFTTHPDKIPEAWKSPRRHPGGFLFSYCHRSRYGWWADEDCPTNVGCPVMIRGDLHHKAETPEITDRIRTDCLIPSSLPSLRPKHLPYLANVQRRLDKELGREAPVFTLSDPKFLRESV